MKAFFAIKTVILCCLFLNVGFVNAQKGKPDMKEVQAKMAQAQHMLDSIQKAIPGMMPKDVKLPPGVKIPASATNGPQLPDLKKLSKDMDANIANVQKYQSQSHEARDAGLPRKGAAVFSAVPNADRTTVIALATSMLPSVTVKLQAYDPMLQQALDTLIQNDTDYTPQAQGMLMLSAGVPTSMAQYMICKGVLLDPDNPWAINDLGIMLRGDSRNKEAAECFRYAYSFNDTFLLIKSNLAWAVTYLGDFITAKKYFHEILNILPNYNSAWEGLGMIAYKEGDIATLFQCLSKQIKTVGAGGDGPSEEFTSFVDGVVQDENVANMGKSAEDGHKTSDNTFDNDNGEEESNQDEPPTAYAEPPNYPATMGAMFPNDIDHLVDVMSRAETFSALITQKLKESAARVKSSGANLPPISPPSYTDDQGMKVTPASSKKYFTMFRWVEAEFIGRVAEVYKGFYAEQQKLILSITSGRLSFMDGYAKAVRDCGDKPPGEREKCEHDLYCEWKPKARGILGANLGAVSELWVRYNNKMLRQLDWYIAASTPHIKRVHNVKWNEYMNAIRQDDVRSAILNSYNRWLPLLGSILDGGAIALAAKEVECITPLREIPATGPDPKNVKLKKLKTAPDYCDPKENLSGEAAGISVDYTCEHTRIGFTPYSTERTGETSMGGLKGSYKITKSLGLTLEHSISQRHKEDDTWSVNGEMKIGAEAKVEGHGKYDAGPIHIKADGEATASANAVVTAGWRFNADGVYEGRAKSIDLSADIAAKGKASASVDGFGERSIDGEVSHGVRYQGEVFAGANSTYPSTSKSNYTTH